MPDYTCFLVVLASFTEACLFKCALRVPNALLRQGRAEFPMEPENREFFRSLLPDHVRSAGVIVDIETDLFEVCVVDPVTRECV